ncbi:MAG: Plug domain-containing protein [Flavobacteriales bacterium]|nr:Plug domain-containing protein [Flavobacteriales bacterium]
MNSLVGIFFLFFLPIGLIAQEVDSTKIIELSLEDLMNVKIRSASHIDKLLKDVPSVVTTYSKEEIERMGANSLIDVLKYIPSIEVSMSPEGNYRAAFRGVRNDGEILILVNEIPINNPYNGRGIFDLPLTNIERIEVIRGPGSVIYGTNALMGVVNIYTTTDETSIIAFSGTNTTYGGGVNFGKKIGEETNLFFNVGYDYSKGANQYIEQDNSYKNDWSLTYMEKEALTNRWISNYFVTGGVANENYEITFSSMRALVRRFF